MSKKKNNNNLLIKLSIILIFTASFALMVSAKPTVRYYEIVKPKQKVQLPHIPKLKSNPENYPTVSSQAVLVLDIPSYIPLYEKNADQKMLPASTAKIITGLVALDYYKPDDILTNSSYGVSGQKMGLVYKETIKFKDLLEGLMVYSANDAAMTLAQNYPGGYSAFVLAMNEKSKKIKLFNSYFENPVGYDGFNNYSTARDLVRASLYALNNPVFAEIVKKKETVVASADGKIVHHLLSTNKLLGEVDGILGVKTGWTENARENLITYYEKDGKKIMIAVLGSSDRFGETKELLNWVNNNYEWQPISI